MWSKELIALLRPTTLVLKVIWAAMTMAIVIYVVVLYVMPFGGENVLGEDGMTSAFYAVAAVLAVVALIVRQRAFSAERLERLAEKPIDSRSLAVDPQTQRLDRDRLRRIEALPPEEQRVLALVGTLRIRTIIVLALNEAVALVGFVAAFLAQSPPVILPCAAAAIVLNLFVFPRPQAVAEQVLR